MAKRIIEISVRDEYVLGAGVVIGAAGSHDDVVLKTTFNDSWAAFNIYATFRDALGENPTVVLLTPEMKDAEDGAYILTIPAAAKKCDGQATLTFTGYVVTSDGTEEDQATNTATARFRVLPSDFALADDGSIDATLAQQMLSSINEYAEVVQMQIEAHEAEVAAQILEHASTVAVEIERMNNAIVEHEKSVGEIDGKVQELYDAAARGEFKGNDYVITEADYEAIAEIVKAGYVDGDEVSY